MRRKRGGSEHHGSLENPDTLRFLTCRPPIECYEMPCLLRRGIPLPLHGVSLSNLRARSENVAHLLLRAVKPLSGNSLRNCINCWEERFRRGSAGFGPLHCRNERFPATIVEIPTIWVDEEIEGMNGVRSGSGPFPLKVSADDFIKDGMVPLR